MKQASIRSLWAAGALIFVGAALTQQATIKPVGNVKQLMRAMTVPASNALFDVARVPPKDDREWEAIEDSAVILGESGNLLLIAGRSKNTAVWEDTSRGMVEAGAAALKAAQARNLDAVIDAGNQMVDTCEVCHESYWER